MSDLESESKNTLENRIKNMYFLDATKLVYNQIIF